MKFIISRNSIYNDKVKPHDKAYRDNVIRIEVRGTDDPKKIPAHHGTDGGWYEDGKNHRVENGRIMRDFDSSEWFIDINTLEELIAFKNEVGSDLVIGNWYGNSNIQYIEIYDDYRE